MKQRKVMNYLNIVAGSQCACTYELMARAAQAAPCLVIVDVWYDVHFGVHKRTSFIRLFYLDQTFLLSGIDVLAPV